MRIICLGDSITAGGQPLIGQWPVHLQFKLEAWRPGVFEVCNWGGGGDTSANGLDRVDRHVVVYQPALVIVEFGLNDSNVRDCAIVPRVSVEEYIKNMREIRRIIATTGGEAVYIINHPCKPPAAKGNGKTFSENFKPYEQALRQLVKELSIPCIDFPAIINKEKIDLDTFLAADKVHLSLEGNRIYGEIVFKALQPMLAEKL